MMREGYERGHQSGEEVLQLRRRVSALEQANESLKERMTALERTREAMLDAITEMIVVLDETGVIQAVNQTAAQRLGHPKEELIGRHSRQFGEREDVHGTGQAHFRRVLETGRPVRAIDEYQGRTYDQTYYPVLDGAGRVTHVVVFALDITARMRVEKQLADSRQHYQDLIENMTDIVYAVDSAGNVLSVNQATERLLGLDPQQVIGTHYGRWMPPAELPRLEKARADALRGQRTTQQFIVSDREGKPHYVESSVGPLLAEGRIVGTQGIIRDITDRFQAELLIREQEGMLRAVFDAATESIFLLDRTGTVLMVNETGARRFGKSVYELIGTRLGEVGEDVFPASLVEYRTRRLREILRTNQAVRFEDERLGRCFDISAYPIFDAKGVVKQVALFAKDITERQRAAEEVRALQRRIEFILGAARTGMNIADRDFHLRYVDPVWRRLYGPYEGKKCYEYFAGADRVCPECGLSKAFETRRVTVYDGTLPKEGNRPIQVTAIPFQAENGDGW